MGVEVEVRILWGRQVTPYIHTQAGYTREPNFSLTDRKEVPGLIKGGRPLLLHPQSWNIPAPFNQNEKGSALKLNFEEETWKTVPVSCNSTPCTLWVGQVPHPRGNGISYHLACSVAGLEGSSLEPSEVVTMLSLHSKKTLYQRTENK